MAEKITDEEGSSTRDSPDSPGELSTTSVILNIDGKSRQQKLSDWLWNDNHEYY